MEDKKPWLEFRHNRWEINPKDDCRINVSANQMIEIDKLYGPLAALGVRIRLEYKQDIADWVVERQRPKDRNDQSSEMEWVEMARWDCQMDWWKDNG